MHVILQLVYILELRYWLYDTYSHTALVWRGLWVSMIGSWLIVGPLTIFCGHNLSLPLHSFFFTWVTKNLCLSITRCLCPIWTYVVMRENIKYYEAGPVEANNDWSGKSLGHLTSWLLSFLYVMGLYIGKYTKVYLTSPEPSTISHNLHIFHRISKIKTV